MLDARGRQFRTLLPRLCRQLAHKAQPLDWRELGRLILAEDRAEAIAEEARVHRPLLLQRRSRGRQRRSSHVTVVSQGDLNT
ncbi:MAG: hypothetical protein ACXW3X_03635 [Rhodoplanes sp.]